jgi:hypothetical protein
VTPHSMKIFNLKHTKKIVPEQGSSNLNSIRAHKVTHVCMHKKKKTCVRVFHNTYCMQILKKLVPKEVYNNFSSEIEQTECHMLHAQEKQTLRKFSITLIA